MRVTQKMIFDSNQYRLNNLTNDLLDVSTVLSTGKRINSLSDDPIGLTQVLDINSALSNIDQLERNIATGRTWLNSEESALNSVDNLITDAKVLSLSMANDTVNAADREAAVERVDAILAQVLDLANTSVNGQYVFAGTATDTTPFAFDDAGNPDFVTYEGNQSRFAVKTGKDSNVNISHDGYKVFGADTVTIDASNNKIDFNEVVAGPPDTVTTLTVEIPAGTYTADELAEHVETVMRNASTVNSVVYDVSYDESNRTFSIADDGTLAELQLLWESGPSTGKNMASVLGFSDAGDAGGASSYRSESGTQWGLFKTLIDLKDHLLSNDVDGLENSIAELDQYGEQINTVISEIGAKGVQLDMKESVIADLEISYQAKRSQIEDADLVSAISDLQAKEYAYQAALASTSTVMQLSLLDYM